MARSFGRKFLDFLWGPAEDEYSDGYDAYGHEATMDDDDLMGMDEEPTPRATSRRRPGRHEEVVELRPPRQPRAEVHYPRSFEDAQALADQFKLGACLIIDLEQVDEKDRSRIVNFLCGVAYGRDGRSQRINDLTFVFAPRHFDLEAEQPRRGSATVDPGFMPRFSVNG
ncbi:MAG: cell division protein SepF [Armatimonadetes bacterium]|nr:cell division protein SepF [Armatimonadota bacterium]